MGQAAGPGDRTGRRTRTGPAGPGLGRSQDVFPRAWDVLTKSSNAFQEERAGVWVNSEWPVCRGDPRGQGGEPLLCGTARGQAAQRTPAIRTPGRRVRLSSELPGKGCREACPVCEASSPAPTQPCRSVARGVVTQGRPVGLRGQGHGVLLSSLAREGPA